MSTTSSKGETRTQSILSTPAANADLESVWRFLEEGMDHIMFSDQISHARATALYTAVYNYMTSMKPSNNQEVRDAQKSALGFPLYEKLKAYLVRYLMGLREGSEIQGKSGVDLLQHYAKEWDRYRTGANHIDHLLNYFNRHWLLREREKGRKGVYPLPKLALIEWKDHFLDPIQGEDMKLTGALLTSIEKQRKGEIVDQELITKVADSFVALGIGEENVNKETMEVYKEQFERPYTETTMKYIMATLGACLTERGAPGFLEEAQKVFVAEEERVLLYVRTFDPKEFIDNCIKVILKDEQIWTGINKSLGNAEEEDIQRIHVLMRNLPEVLEPVRQKIGELDKKTVSDA